MKVENKNSSSNLKQKILVGISSLIGILIGRYSGIYLLIPLGFSYLAFWVGKKVLPQSKRIVLPSSAVQTGHMLWMIAGILIAHRYIDVAFDIVVLIIGISWLLLKPSIKPLILLSVYQLVALVLNAFALTQAVVGTSDHKALVVHVVWRVLALYLMVRAYFEFKKSRNIGFTDFKSGDENPLI